MKLLSGGEVWRRRLVLLGFIFGIWTLVGIFFASQIYFYFVRTERAVTFTKALVWQLAAVYLLALATPPVLWFAKHFRFERQSWRRSLLAHGLAAILFAVVVTVGHVILDLSFDKGVAYLSFARVMRTTFVMIDKNLIIYCLIVFISYASVYYKQYRESELAAAQLAHQLAEAQLQALKMQLHPHFLFNALHSISSLLSKDTETARRMIARLGDFLRLTLENSGAQEIALKQEMEFLRCYLEIERIRFHDRLTVRMDVDPQTLDCQVPNLILQPIVENAIRHGIAPRSTPGLVEVKAERSNGMLRLQVKDNGPGLLSGLDIKKDSGTGIGLSNTRGRLTQLYGEAHRFEMLNDPRGGLVVTLDIPFLTEK